MPLYQIVFDEFKKELEQCAEEIFLYPLPFTQINKLAMLAATVAERCAGGSDSKSAGADSEVVNRSVIMMSHVIAMLD